MICIKINNQVFERDDIVWVKTVNGDMNGRPFYFSGRLRTFTENSISLDTSKEFVTSNQSIDISNISRICLFEKNNLCNDCVNEIPSCSAENIEFGTDVGNDNVIRCDKFACKF